MNRKTYVNPFLILKNFAQDIERNGIVKKKLMVEVEFTPKRGRGLTLT
jgi:hypothetical protein